jgi:predicted Zn-dependent protease
MDELDALLQLHPGQRGVASLLSMTFARSTRFQEPIRLLESATQFDPESAGSWLWLGRAQLQLGRHAEAEAAFRRAYALDRWSVVAGLGLADALIKQGVLGEAREVLAAMPRRLGAKAWIHKLEADIYAAEGKLPEAAESYTAALLNTRGGPEIAAGIEKDCLETEDIDWPAVITRYQAAVNRLFPVHQKKMTEQDWHSLARRFNRTAWTSQQESAPDAEPATAGPRARRLALRRPDETDD